ncbi:long-chain fatty acid--CoA ligase [Rhodococcus sp. ABRD24]|uniref:class I adenylate-forming enzyme family protein n=1 Tax=Rhodococcus sp. ABRD24 TaxID=2507582 RepID=UPI00103A5E87|nr:class I adenylate-forming enzyme family protein [Rhodococcus sp. ABRD24]QBJ95764.1 long-chain fatty acid--CoA ligase [Rhodococcus sp. ABRD24]
MTTTLEGVMHPQSSIHTSPLGRATLGDQLRRHARTIGDKPAFISYSADGTRDVCTYRDLDERAARFAHALLDRGVRRGDRIAVMARNGIETVIAYYGALKVGAAFSGINVLFGAREVGDQLAHLEPAVVVAGAEFTAVVDATRSRWLSSSYLVIGGESSEDWISFEAALADSGSTEPDCDVDEHDLAMIVYTSGTEAAPKGVMITHRNYLISTAPAWSWGLRTQPDDVWLYVMPFHTIAGIGSMTTLTMMGATLVLPASTEAGRSLEMIRDEGITVIAQTPTFYISLSNHPLFAAETVGTVQRCMTYGGQVSPHAIAAWSAAAPSVVWGTYWGQSELSQLGAVGWFRTLEDIPDQDPTWIGKPVSHLEIRVVDAEGNDAESGELICRSPSVMSGYFKDPERTAATLRDGWVHTGDIVRQDEAGNLFFLDRSKDMIKTGGLNVSSQEVERALQSHPDVVRAAVVGLPDEYWSEVVTGFVMVKPDSSTSEEELRVYCRDQLANYKVPKAINIVEELPVDPQGKLLKRELRRVHGGVRS